MGHEDVERVTQLIKRVAANRTVLMVEHNLSVVASICRHDHGAAARRRSSPRAPTPTVSKDPQVLEAYMGSADEALAGHA